MVDGFFLNNQMTDFAFRPIDDQGRPAANAVAPGKRPRSSMTPAILLTPDGRFAGAIGSAGGNAILAYVAKSLVGAIDWNLPMQQALAAAQPRRARAELPGRSDQILAGDPRRPSRQRGIDLKPGQGEDSGVHGVLIRDGRIDGGVRPAPRRRGADPAETALGAAADRFGDAGIAVALQPLRQARRRSAGRCPGPRRPSPSRAGPGSRPAGSAPRRRRRWRCRRRRSAEFRRRWRCGTLRSASSASGFSGAPDSPPCLARVARLQRRPRDGRVGDDQRVDVMVERGADDPLVIAAARGPARP